MLFEQVIIPPAVATELSRDRTPQSVREWIISPPSWLQIREPSQELAEIDLGAGERQAISLAKELHSDALLIDDRKARRIAEEMGLVAVGTLNVLDAAAGKGLLDIKTTIEKLRTTNFRISEAFVQHVLSKHRRGT